MGRQLHYFTGLVGPAYFVKATVGHLGLWGTVELHGDAGRAVGAGLGHGGGPRGLAKTRAALPFAPSHSREREKRERGERERVLFYNDEESL